ncbi:LCP family protein [Anaerolentibacter hominis]|uniref:LCP family protein n=1 Tax=Anaerolentibacter hominis TaxID=3079009 RepID=UPI0031B8429A
MKVKHALKKRKWGFILSGVQVIISFVLFGLIAKLNVLQLKYMVILAAVILFVDVYVVMSQFSRKLHWVGKVCSVLLCCLLLLGSSYLSKAHSTLDHVTEKEDQVDEMSVVVLKDNAAEALSDIADRPFGIQAAVDRDHTDQTIEDINKALKTEIQIKEFEDVEPLVQALYDKDVEAIIINEAFRNMILENHENFDKDTRILDAYTKKEDLQIEVKEQEVTEEIFHVYLSGIDTYGSISNTSRSDVNIIATVNPMKKQILLTTTPRDYYVTTTVSGTMPDKLTHAGIYGVDCSIGTLETLYGIDISYYVKVNFTGFIKIVDALGGVTVHSDYNFRSDWGPSFVKGDNHVNGEQALAFARERHHLPGGDNQRGKDQQYLLKAIFEKATSPSIIKNFNKVMDSVAESVKTNMPSSDITKLMKMQLNDMASWEIVMVQATGSNSSARTYSIPSKNQYVMRPDLNSVEVIKEMLKQMEAGETVTEDTYKQLLEQKSAGTAGTGQQ